MYEERGFKFDLQALSIESHKMRIHQMRNHRSGLNRWINYHCNNFKIGGGGVVALVVGKVMMCNGCRGLGCTYRAWPLIRKLMHVGFAPHKCTPSPHRPLVVVL